MNDYEQRNRLAKTLAIQTGLLLEHFQWGKQGVSDEEVVRDLAAVQKTVEALRSTFRESKD